VKPSTNLGLALAVLLSSAGTTSSQEKASFLPFMGPRLEAARYAPAEIDGSWVGWIGASVDLVEKGKWSAYFNPNVETVLGHRVRSFEAVQANYSLEVGARREVGRGTLFPFFHHVSRHEQDREKLQAVDWNFLGVGYSSPWPARWQRRGAFRVSLGVATLSSGVDYNWELRLSADIELARKENRALFLLTDLRHVGAHPTPAFPRDQVNDLRAEAGFRRWQDHSSFDLFVAYERRADAVIPMAKVAERALFGFRIRAEKRAAPAIAPLP